MTTLVARGNERRHPGTTVDPDDGGVMFGRSPTAVWAEAIKDWAIWMDAQNRSPATIRQWRWHLRGFAEANLRRSPWRVTTEQIYTWYTGRGWRSGTMRGARSAVRSFYQWAEVAGRTRRNPAHKLPAIPSRPGLPRPATEATIRRALAHANDKTRLMILFGAKAGLRCAEIAALRWTDIGPAAIRVINGKGGRHRIVDLHPVLATELAAEHARRRAGRHGTGWRFAQGGLVWVFPGRRGHTAPRWVSQCLSDALGPGTTAQMLRHRAATRALEATGDLAAVQDFLGHATPTTTRIYARVSKRARRAVIEAL